MSVKTIVVEVPKEQASMLYFVLESNDNIAFYSTIECEDKTKRRIELNVPNSLEVELENILSHFKTRYSLKTISSH